MTGRGDGAHGELVLLERFDGYAVVTLNRPEKANAMNAAAQTELAAALDAVREDCRAVVLTGAGHRSFCAGVDLSERRGLSKNQVQERLFSWGADPWFEIQERILRHPAVFVAAVNGAALGGGLTLVNNCEIAVASDAAVFGMPEIGLGTFPALSGASTLHRILPKHAAYLVLTADRVDAEKALRWGLVTEVVRPDDVLSRAKEIAAIVGKLDPVVVDFSKRAVREVPTMDWSRSIDYGLRTGMVVRANSDAAVAGVTRFLDRAERGGGNTSAPSSTTAEPHT
ncbi:MAG: hypothetical protein GEV10_18790 [Streptosporangiales bacterium]|nr:hypothetical protein [Streptosporangiales bacterium]